MVLPSEYTPASSSAPRQIDHLELRELEQAIELLTNDQRTAVVLAGLTPADYNEIGLACGVPTGTIRSRLSRGRETLRKLTAMSLPRSYIEARSRAAPVITVRRESGPAADRRADTEAW